MKQLPKMPMPPLRSVKAPDGTVATVQVGSMADYEKDLAAWREATRDEDEEADAAED